MLNRLLCLLFLCTILCTTSAFSQSKVKRIFQDNRYDNRTNVIKETGENDYNILDEQFGDTKVGEVVRIAIEKPKQEKPPKAPKAPKEKVVVKKPVKEVVKLPKVRVEQEVFKVKGASASVPAPRKTHFSASPSEYAPYKTYQAQLPKLKFWKKKKRKRKSGKNNARKSCYFFN